MKTVHHRPAKTLLAALLASLIFSLMPARGEDKTVLVVLIDGFAPALVKAADTPNLDRMAREGSFSHHLLPVFPSMSMVNHTSFATGCWPSKHGIMSNIFVDPTLGRYESSPDADWRTGCQSVWEIAEAAGVKTAALGITGSYSKSLGATAQHTLPVVPWEERLSDEARTAHAISLLNQNDEDRPRLIVLYLSGPDDTAHGFGVLAPETLRAATEADARVGELLEAITANDNADRTSLMIAADHGMADVSPLINITRIMNRHRIKGQQASDGATAFLYLDNPDDIERAYKRLNTYSEFETFKRGAHPAYSHLGDGQRAGDILLITQPPYWFAGAEVFPLWSKIVGVTRIWPDVFVPPMGSGLAATHGYAPSHPDMQTIFYAWGADIRAGQVIENLDMIDIAPTALDLLGLEVPAAVDGKIIKALFDSN